MKRLPETQMKRKIGRRKLNRYLPLNRKGKYEIKRDIIETKGIGRAGVSHKVSGHETHP